jgi:hypothetical protein
MTKQVELLEMLERTENQRSARRSFIRLCGGAAAMTGGLALLSACDDDNDDVATPAPTPTATPTPVSSSDAQDIAVLSFALQLEYLEANYYSYAVTGFGIPTALQTGVGTQGSVIAGSGTNNGTARAVTFTDPVIREYAREIAADEIAHVIFLRNALGSAAPAQPTINLSGNATVTAPGGSVVGAFTAAARAAGVIGATDIFDPFANDINFLIGSYLLTDVGVSAYRGSARLITNKTFLEASAGILATEAYHDGVIRSSIYARGISATPPLINNQNIFTVIQRISNTRDGLDGATDTDQDIGDATTANLVPTDRFGLVLGRTAPQVLNVVYQNAAAGTTQGGFFPAGVNGTIRATA